MSEHDNPAGFKKEVQDNDVTLDNMKVLLLEHGAMDADGEHMTITNLTTSEALSLMGKIVTCFCDTDDEEVKKNLGRLISYMTNAYPSAKFVMISRLGQLHQQLQQHV